MRWSGPTRPSALHLPGNRVCLTKKVVEAGGQSQHEPHCRQPRAGFEIRVQVVARDRSCKDRSEAVESDYPVAQHLRATRRHRDHALSARGPPLKVKSDSRAAAIVLSRSASLCESETNIASNCEGGM